MDEKSGDELERTPPPRPAPTATVSSLDTHDSTEQLISNKTGSHVEPASKERSVRPEEPVGGRAGGRRLLVALGLAQLVLGALLTGAGAAAVVKGAALARVGAGLWAGCVAVVAGVVGVLAGINDCYGLNKGNGGPLLSVFLATSLVGLACGNSAAVLAATGLHRDATHRAAAPHSGQHTFEDEVEAWSPVLSNIALLTVASLHCLVCLLTIYHVSKRVCPCLRPRQPYDHNQFDPAYRPALVAPYVVRLQDEKCPRSERDRARQHDACKQLEVRLQGGADNARRKEEQQYGSANSRERLVSSWLGRQGAGGAGGRGRGVRKGRQPPPVVLLHPSHPASTLGRMPVGVMAGGGVVPPRYATLPLAPYPHPPHPPPLYYPVHDAQRVRRRRSPAHAHGAARAERRRRREARERDSQLTRSLERIHRKRRADRDRLNDADLKRTYTGLDRAYAEQFIAVCDESRSHAAEQSDSLTSTVSSDLTSDNTHRY